MSICVAAKRLSVIKVVGPINGGWEYGASPRHLTLHSAQSIHSKKVMGKGHGKMPANRIPAFPNFKNISINDKASIDAYTHRHQPYAQTPIIGRFSAGIYAEKDVGWGPRVSWKLNKNSSLWAAVPVKDRSDVSAVMGVEIAF